MQPADAAPAATEPPTADGTGQSGAPGQRGGAGQSGGSGTADDVREAGVVPQPRTGPDAAAPAVPQPRPATEPVAETAPPAAAGTRPESGLTERELGILAFEQQWWRHAGAKEQAIRDTFGLSATRYYQLLNALLDNPAALAAEPVLVGRLRRLRSSRARNRRR
ncbi:DUF3263 domain-containing protein [Micromonospora sp. CPCC 205561]|uniref:DUF3263 domain-containing protein n=1 Tax=Micromonospora sp. CPCC 205561 TaxID=3122407 RepID=UPI002FEEB00A